MGDHDRDWGTLLAMLLSLVLCVGILLHLKIELIKCKKQHTTEEVTSHVLGRLESRLG